MNSIYAVFWFACGAIAMMMFLALCTRGLLWVNGQADKDIREQVFRKSEEYMLG